MIRNDRLRRKLDEKDIEIIVASTPQNVFYLSGLQSLSQELLGERAFAICTRNSTNPYIILPAVDASIVADTDLDYERVYTYGSFYLYKGKGITESDQEVLTLKNEQNYDGPIEALIAVLNTVADEESTVALERTGLSPDENETVTTEFNFEQIHPTEEICSDLRRLKSDEEVHRLRRSVEINEESINAAIDKVEPGMTERDLKSIYEQNLVSKGAEPLFTVIGFGSHGAYPHAVPGERELQEGDLIRFDVGCTYENYSSDIARTFAFRQVDETVKRKYEVLNESMDRSMELLEDGVTTNEVFKNTLAYIQKEGADVFETFNRNHFGHGIGIDVYDPPTIDREKNEIATGMVMCVEPPYYELGTGGIQVEDEVLVTDDGVERFSKCPESLRVIE